MVTVTPAVAAEWLKRNTHNRRIRPSVVERYVAEIKAGEWRPTPGGVGFDETGTLIDGQHRLSAIVQAGIPAPLLVVTGFATAAQEKCDRHTRRNLADVMILSGIAHSKYAVQAASVLARIRLGIDNYEVVSDRDVRECLVMYGESAEAMRDQKKTYTGRPGSVILNRAACLAALAVWHRHEPTEALAFRAELVAENAPYQDSPSATLRRAIAYPAWYGVESGGAQRQATDWRKTWRAIVAQRRGERLTAVKAWTGELPWQV